MDTYDSLFSPESVLNEQIARQVFEVLPEDGPLVLIVDTDGHCWPSDSERYGSLEMGQSFLRDLTAKVDDGAEPVVTAAGDCSVIAAQLATERTNCGYILIALAHYSPESVLANIGLVETVISLAGLIARLIEKNARLYELQMKHFNVYGQAETSLN